MKLIQTAFKSRIASYRVHSENRYSDYNMFFESIKNKVIHLLSEVIKIHNAVKVIMELFGRYILQTQKIVDNKSFNTANKVIDSAAGLNDVFYVFVDLMTTQMSEFQKRDSEINHEYDVPMGEFLGEITDELESYGPGSYITEFVSGGPKKYAYRVFSTRDKEERVVCKVKGISLNYAASQLVNFEIIKSMILEPMSAGPVSITSRNILRTK
ncbi:hypothetical protein NQ318_006699 [Aromia moschata]|uniref:Uncharacterized protein n=1 Tax=Aromia moschata TaxID=1265417 RepID=A0AAV8YR27_9CUCU|nr:hypothetical protein NQ318_006699 [Aromia moschata]